MLRMNKLYRIYHMAFVYVALCFGSVAIAVTPLMIFSYVMSFFSPTFGNFPWWSLLFIVAYGAAGFFIRKAAIWELKRQKTLAAGASGEA
jgi:hypothetical protein